MLRNRARKPTLLGQAFALKNNPASEVLADNLHLRDTIARKRRRLMSVIGVGILILATSIFILLTLI